MAAPKILVLNRSADLAERVAGVVDDMTPKPEVVSCERVGSVGDVLENDGPFDLLIGGPSLGTRAGLGRLSVIHEFHPEIPLIIAFAERPDASLRDIVRAGASDLVQLPADDETLVTAIERGLEISAKFKGIPLPEAVAAPTSSIRAPGEPGRVFTVSSATGGCGKTFFSTNLAYFLAQYSGGRVCVIDLDLQFGEMATALRLRPKYTIYDAIEQDEGEEVDLEEQITEYLVAHETGIHLLAAPRQPEEADRIDPPDVTRVVEAVRAHFDYVVVDTPTALTEVVLAALDLSDLLYVMGTMDLPSVRNMSVFLGTLDKLKIPAENVRLILNKAETDVGIDLAQVRRLFPKEFEAVLPYAKEVYRSINQGLPVMAYSPDSEITRRLLGGLKVILPADKQDDVPDDKGKGGKGFFRKFGRD